MHVFKAGESARVLLDRLLLCNVLFVSSCDGDNDDENEGQIGKNKNIRIYTKKKCCSPILFVTVWYLLGVLFYIALLLRISFVDQQCCFVVRKIH